MKIYVFKCGHRSETKISDKFNRNHCPVCNSIGVDYIEFTCPDCGGKSKLNPYQHNRIRCDHCRVERKKITDSRKPSRPRGAHKSSAGRLFGIKCNSPDIAVIVRDEYTALWTAVLEQGIKDFLLFQAECNKRKREGKDSLDHYRAYRWIKTKGVSIGSFDYCCGIVGFDIEHTRQRILSMGV